MGKKYYVTRNEDYGSKQKLFILRIFILKRAKTELMCSYFFTYLPTERRQVQTQESIPCRRNTMNTVRT